MSIQDLKLDAEGNVSEASLVMSWVLDENDNRQPCEVIHLDVSNILNDMKEHRHSEIDELEFFCDNIKDFGLPSVSNVGDSGDFGLDVGIHLLSSNITESSKDSDGNPYSVQVAVNLEDFVKDENVEIIYDDIEAAKRERVTLYLLIFSAGVALFACRFEDGDVLKAAGFEDQNEEDGFYVIEIDDLNFFDLHTKLRDPSNEDNDSFAEMSSDVEALEDWDEDDEE